MYWIFTDLRRRAQDKLNAKDIALTKDASDVEYKTLVERLSFMSKTNVKTFCAELAANLKAKAGPRKAAI